MGLDLHITLCVQPRYTHLLIQWNQRPGKVNVVSFTVYNIRLKQCLYRSNTPLKKVFFSQSHRRLGRKNLTIPNTSRTCDLLFRHKQHLTERLTQLVVKNNRITTQTITLTLNTKTNIVLDDHLN